MIFASGIIVERTLVTRPRLSTHRCACMLHNQNLIPFLVPPPSCLSVFFEVVVVVVANFLEDVTAMTWYNDYYKVFITKFVCERFNGCLTLESVPV